MVVGWLPLARKAVNEFGLPLQYQDVIRQQAAEKHLDPGVHRGCHLRRDQIRRAHVVGRRDGLMQILPQTAEFLARRSGAKTFHISDLTRRP